MYLGVVAPPLGVVEFEYWSPDWFCLCHLFSALFKSSLKIPFLLPISRQNPLKDPVQQALVSTGQLPEEAECLTVPKYKRDLVQKLKILRQELSQQQPQAGHCRIEVSREEIFEVRREWHHCCYRIICYPIYVLFIYFHAIHLNRQSWFDTWENWAS